MKGETCLQHVGMLALAVVVAVCLAVPAIAQTAPAVRVAVVPLVDATGAGSRTAGIAASQRMIDELSASGRAVGVAVDAAAVSTSAAMDQESAVALGKQKNATFVFVGTVREATTKESTRGGWLPKIKDNSVHLTVRSIEAKTTLDGALYDVATGSRVLSVTTHGAEKDRSYTGRVWSSWGSWDVADDAAFMASPLGKAFLQATREMVTKIGDATSARAAARN